jgi:hypothetical protein
MHDGALSGDGEAALARALPPWAMLSLCARSELVSAIDYARSVLRDSKPPEACLMDRFSEMSAL